MALRRTALLPARLARRALRGWRVQRRLRAGEALRPGPWWVQIGIDDRCNYRCAMCWAHSPLLPSQPHGNTLPRAEFERLIRDLRELGARRIEVCGSGEPMLHQDALPMIRLVKELGMECVLITNGSRLSEPVCAEFVDMGLDALAVSVHAGTDEAHRAITGAPLGERRRIMQILGHIVRLRDQGQAAVPSVGVIAVLQKANYRELVRLAEEAAELRLDNLEFVSLGINPASAGLALSPEEGEEATRQVVGADAIMRAVGKGTNAAAFLGRPRETEWTRRVFQSMPCYIGQFFCRVNANGEVNPCCGCSRVVGSVTGQSFAQIWRSETYRLFRREALGLPERCEPVAECRCYTCGHHPFIVQYHEDLTAGRFANLL